MSVNVGCEVRSRFSVFGGIQALQISKHYLIPYQSHDETPDQMDFFCLLNHAGAERHQSRCEGKHLS